MESPKITMALDSANKSFMRYAMAAGGAAAAILLATGCDRDAEHSSPEAQTSAAVAKPASSVAAPKAPGVGIPVDPKRILKALNPKDDDPYSGPTGTIRGLVSVSGDEAPVREEVLAEIPDSCPRAKTMYGPLFREGMMRALGDALVTVTGYDRYVPEKEEAVAIVADDCAWDRRTLGMTFGQRIEATGKDAEGYVPELVGARMAAQLVLVPGGDPVKLYPPQPGRYILTDSIKPFMQAEILVMKYPTHDVTGLDGEYEIRGIPPGEVTITAFSPQMLKTAEKRVKVEPGKVHEVDLEIVFDKEAFEKSQNPSDSTKKE